MDSTGFDRRRFLTAVGGAALLAATADLLHTAPAAAQLPQVRPDFGAAATAFPLGQVTLSGWAQAYAVTGEAIFKEKADYMVAALAECQAASAGFNTGYLSGSPESDFDTVETGTRKGVPYYCIHKTMAGLLDVWRLTENLQTRDVLLADYYEQALTNHLLGQQDPDSDHGHVVYFTGLNPGGHRGEAGPVVGGGSYSTDYTTFWCCQGTGLEIHTKLMDSAYFSSGSTLYVNLFMGSALTRTWAQGDTVTVRLPMSVVLKPAPDNPHVQAVTYGPVVLSGAFGETDLDNTLPVLGTSSIQATATPLRFTANNGQHTLMPFYDSHHQNHTVYWDANGEASLSTPASFRLVNAASGLVLGIRNMSTADGGLALQWGDTGTADQLWRFA